MQLSGPRGGREGLLRVGMGVDGGSAVDGRHEHNTGNKRTQHSKPMAQHKHSHSQLHTRKRGTGAGTAGLAIGSSAWRRRLSLGELEVTCAA
jgi:hypothetical protein